MCEILMIGDVPEKNCGLGFWIVLEGEISLTNK